MATCCSLSVPTSAAYFLFIRVPALLVCRWLLHSQMRAYHVHRPGPRAGTVTQKGPYGGRSRVMGEPQSPGSDTAVLGNRTFNESAADWTTLRLPLLKNAVRYLHVISHWETIRL